MNNSYQGNWHVLIRNLPVVGAEYSLGSGLIIRPLRENLDVFKLAELGAIGFKQWSVLEPIISQCTTEIVSSLDSDSLASSYDHLNRAWLAVSLLCIKGYTNSTGIACSTFSWDEFENIRKPNSINITSDLDNSREDPPRFIGDLLDYHVRQIAIDQNIKALTECDCNWVAESFSSFNKLASSSQSFRFALEAAVDWRYSKDFRAAISRVWSGIEAILELKTETVYRLSTTTAALLAPRGEERIVMYKSIKKLYDVRSKAVHGGQLKDETQKAALHQSFTILTNLLLLCISKGKVLDSDDFEKALFT